MNALKNSLVKNFKSYHYAIRGILHVFGHENNIRYQSVAAVITIILGFSVGLNPMEWLWIILMIGLVFMAETFNTAIEKLIDHVHPQHHPAIGLVKDISAGAVLIISITAAVVGFILFINKIIDF